MEVKARSWSIDTLTWTTYCNHMKRPKVNVIKVRVDDTMFARWTRAAEMSGMSLSEWLRMRAEGTAIVQVIEPKRAA